MSDTPDTGGLDGLSLTQLKSLNNQFGADNGNVYTAAINAIESHGKEDTSTVRNEKSGATGSMQTMKNTQRDPGYGVKPWNGKPEDRARVGRDYYNALNQKYGDPNVAAVAYNWGPGNTDMWLKSGGDINKLPLETLKYLRDFDSHVAAFGGGPPTKPPDLPAGAKLPEVPPLKGGGQQEAPVATPTVATPGAVDNGLGFQTMDEFYQQYPGLAKPAAEQPGALSSIAAGFDKASGDLMFGGQKLLGQGLQAIGAKDTGGALVKDAEDRLKETKSRTEARGSETGWGTVGKVIPAVAATLGVGPEILPQVLAGGGIGALEGTASGEGTVTGAVKGALGGAAGAAAGKVIGAGVQAAKPAVTNAIRAIKGGEPAAAAKIAAQLGPDAAATVQALQTGAKSAIPGVERTAAEAAPLPGMVGIQKAAAETSEGAKAFGERAAQNAEARVAAARDVVGPRIDVEVGDFTRNQDALLAQGQNELPNLSEAASNAMGARPAFNKGLSDARRQAADELGANHPFADQLSKVHGEISDDITKLIGTPADLDAMRAARSAQAANDYAKVSGYVPFKTPGLKDLVSRPGFRDAYAAAAGLEKNRAGLGGMPGILQGGGRGPAGEWVPKMIDLGALQDARAMLAQKATNLIRDGQRIEGDAHLKTLDALDSFLNTHSPHFAQANSNFKAASIPIDRMATLQNKLVGAVDPLTNQVNPSKFRAAVNAIEKEQMKVGPRAADKVSKADLDALKQLGQRAAGAETNLKGLSPQGQEYLRQSLERNAGKNTESQAAHDAFQNYLRSNSPSYAAHMDNLQTVGKDLGERQLLGNAVDKLQMAAESKVGLTHANASRALGDLHKLPGQTGDFARGLLNDLKQTEAASRTIPATPKQSAASGILGKMMHNVGEGAAYTAALAGHPVKAIGSLVAGEAVKRVQAKTAAATIELLKNPEKLAKELQKYANNPSAKKAFVDALKKKASASGRAGAAAVQAFNLQGA